ncbi:MAG: hypothetical protein KDH97_17575 [Calditrichaeota bacterium]|nr:hypothetical protein [Calditrichota bacterium]MCB9090886.1 hypothetical protein [Calditrichia bacterium]
MKLKNATTAKPAATSTNSALLLMWLPLMLPVNTGSQRTTVEKSVKK